MDKLNLKPRGAFRPPLSNAKENGQIVNPPRYTDMKGQMDAGSARSNSLKVRRPGFEK